MDPTSTTLWHYTYFDYRLFVKGNVGLWIGVRPAESQGSPKITTHGPSAPIASLHSFDPILEEVMELPFPAGYREYMNLQVEKLAKLHAARIEKDKDISGRRPAVDSANSDSAGIHETG